MDLLGMHIHTHTHIVLWLKAKNSSIQMQNRVLSTDCSSLLSCALHRSGQNYYLEVCVRLCVYILVPI